MQIDHSWHTDELVDHVRALSKEELDALLEGDELTEEERDAITTAVLAPMQDAVGYDSQGEGDTPLPDGDYLFTAGDDGDVWVFGEGSDEALATIGPLDGVAPGSSGWLRHEGGVFTPLLPPTGDGYDPADTMPGDSDFDDDPAPSEDDSEDPESFVGTTDDEDDEDDDSDTPAPVDPTLQWREYLQDPSASCDVDGAYQSSLTWFEDLVTQKVKGIDFLATSKFAFVGLVPEDVRAFFAPVALRGKVTFTRNRTRPNEFTISDLVPAYPEEGFPLDQIGVGDDRAIDKLKAELKRMAKTDVYPYRDGDRIVIN